MVHRRESGDREDSSTGPPGERSAAPLPTLLAMAFFAYLAMTLPVFAAPGVARTFHLGDRGIVFLAGIISLGSLGTFALTRLADRRGRRRALLLAFAGLPPLAVASGLSPVVWVYAMAQMGSVACFGTLRSVTMVAVTEVADEGRRARAQGFFGVASALGGAVPLGMAALLEASPGGWRWLFAALGLAVVALPFVWRRLHETLRFEDARARGATRRARVRDLLSSRYRRRALGLTAAGVLRSAALTAMGAWAWYHAVRTLGLPPWLVAVVYASGGGLGMLGVPMGALLSERWGRRPAFAFGLLVTLIGGIGFFHVPGGMGRATLAMLAAAFFCFNFGTQAFGVADRLVDTELFPTPLRATYVGMRSIGEAFAQTSAQFGLSVLVAAMGSLSGAITVLAAGAAIPSLGLFLYSASESRGMRLEVSALEEEGSGAHTGPGSPGSPGDRVGISRGGSS